MARRNTKKDTIERRWLELTWDELDDWAGQRAVERGRDYRRAGQVQELALTAEGGLLAWVRGGHRYATHVRLRADTGGTPRLWAACTCPMRGPCKHAVAVVLAYLDARLAGEAVPAATASDPRLRLLAEIEQPGGEPGRDEQLSPDELLRWYDRQVESRAPGPLTFGWVDEQARVADAVAATHPDRAVVLYQEVSERHLARGTPSGYEAARPYLRKARRLLEQIGGPAAWDEYLAWLRQTFRRDLRVLDLLDRLDGGRILAG
jgi:uncharacterized Zn finger protein